MTSRHLGYVLAAAFVAMTCATAGAADEATATETTTVTVETTEVSIYAATAPYVSIGGVYAIESNDSRLGQTSDGANGYDAPNYAHDLKNSGGYDLRIGYGFAKNFAAEVEWQSMVNMNTHEEFTFVDGNGDVINSRKAPALEARMLSLNGRYSPLTGRLQPYALFGLGWFNVQADRQAVSIHESAFASRFGLGLAFFITERAGLSFEAGYILPLTNTIGGKDRFNLIPMTLSVFFKFK